jgi:Skp family chaperone for outer membrane proteins
VIEPRRQPSRGRGGGTAAVGYHEQENRTVKRTVLLAEGILALGVMLYIGRLEAQPGGTPAPAAAPTPRTRIALLNLTYVIKHYEKFTHFQEEMKQAFKPFADKDRKLKAEAESLTKEIQALPASQEAEREEKTKRLKVVQRDLQDNSETAKSYLGKKTDEQMKILYFDIMDAASRHARAHDFELVLHYNDAIEKVDFFSSQNISRKLQAGALMPLYAVGGLDISKEVVESLNYALRSQVPTGNPTGAPGGGN